MNKLFFALLLFINVSLFGQTNHDGLQFSRTEFNYGKVENWISTIDTIEVKNISSQRLFLLKQHYPQQFEVSFPSSALNPGETGIIAIIYNPKVKGKFNVSIPVNHSASQTAVDITFKGEVLNFDEYASAACPSFTKPHAPLEFDMEILVRDSVTKQPLANSLIEIEKGESYTQHQTDNNGTYKQRASIGFCFLYAEHAGYKSKSLLKNFNHKNNKVVIDLSPLAPKEKSLQLFKDTIINVKKEIAVVKTEEHPDFSLSGFKENNIVFLIDVSSSMNVADRMPLLQKAMIQLTNLLRPEDKLTIITYANDAQVKLAGVSGSDREKIIAVIQQLKCGGRTSGGKAIKAAYDIAEKNFKKQGVNQIILSTDGGFNGLADTEEELMKLIEKKAGEQIEFSVLAFGKNRIGKQLIMQLANKGNGFYLNIQNEDDANAKLIETLKMQSKK